MTECHDMPPKLSQPMIRFLKALRAGQPPWLHCRSQSDYGGLSSTLHALRRRKLIGWKSGNLTKEGKKVIDEIDPPPLCPRCNEPVTTKPAFLNARTYHRACRTEEMAELKRETRGIDVPLTDDERTVLIELYAENVGSVDRRPKEWMRASRLSGPVRSAQAKAFRGLLRKGLVERKRSDYHPNRNQCWVWRVSPLGTKKAVALLLDLKVEYGA